MYTIQENVRIVIALLKQYNIRYLVLSPGGTNIPLVHAVQNDSFFTCYSVVDERSAMYFAIGLYLQTGEIVATSCTSAQATRNYIPGLTEAFYKHVPILAITTAKLERFQYQDYMQAPDQCSLPRDSVKKSFDLPPVTDDNTRIQCIHTATEAILELRHRGCGPVQLNIRIVDKLQGKFERIDLPNLPKVKRYSAYEKWKDINLTEKKILIVIGEHRPFTQRQQEALDMFCRSYNVVVYKNHLSNFNNDYSVHSFLLMSCDGIKFLEPDVIITIGGQTGDYPLFGALCGLENAEHWRVSEDGNYVNTYNHLSKIFECPDYYFFERFESKGVSDHNYYDSWKKLNDTMNYNIEVPFSNIFIAQSLYKDIPQHSIMNFAILNSLRSWSYFPLDETINCYANVAAFGTDGGNSMLIGESMEAKGLCFMITGDLAFFYDMNSLGIRHITNNLRIILVNNSGGAEFVLMTQHWIEDVNVNNYISACGHNGNAKGWSENCGFTYLSASTKDELLQVKNEFLSVNGGPILLEVFTDSIDEQKAYETFSEKNRLLSSDDRLKNIVGSIIGKKGMSVIKKMMGN